LLETQQNWLEAKDYSEKKQTGNHKVMSNKKKQADLETTYYIDIKISQSDYDSVKK